MDAKYQETIKTWNKIAQLYEDKSMESDLYNDTYDTFCESINNDTASILEIGCGPGNITRYITSRKPLFRIYALDVSKNMFELAKKNNPTADFRVMDCRDLGDIKKTFDAVICGFTIPYLSESDCSRLLSDCHNLLKELQMNAFHITGLIKKEYKKYVGTLELHTIIHAKKRI